MTDEHAEYAPSSMYLTINCPGWKKQAALMPPETDTEAAKEGDAGHWVAATTAITAEAGYLWAAGALAPNGVEVTEEMLDGAALWVEALEGYPARIESRIYAKSIHKTKCWGTPDARQWAPETKTSRIADYKFGFGFVDEFENWQCLTYHVGQADELGLWGDPDIKFESTIVQPRYYNGKPIRTWTIQTAGLHHYAERMRTAVAEAESPSPRVISGTHCTYCPARATCDVYRKTCGNAIDFAGRPDPMAGTPEDVGRELKVVQEFIKRLEARETGLAALAETMIRQGKRVPYFSFEQTVGRLAWTAEPAVLEMIAQLSGKTIMAPVKPITPTQAIQRKILADKIVNMYASRPNGAFKLVPDSTKTIRSFST